MNRLIGICGALVLAASGAACGGGNDATSSTSQTVAATNTTAETSSTAAEDTTTTSTSPAAASSTCTELTTAATQGPYYVTGTAALADGNLNYDSLPGDSITISGYVFSGTGTDTPLANAIVDIWHADDAGAYWPQSNGPATQYTAEQLSLRGHVVTDAEGFYSFSTIYPGEYEGRARHIHIRATSADGTQDVTTQLIVSKTGDTTPAANDSIAQSLPACNTMNFTDANGTQTASFDFHL
jgi:protocatechuate 3,4-dioxygenase beta subunit